jgi:hypothetical protein
MLLKKIVICGFIVLILLALIYLFVNKRNDTHLEEGMINFTESIEQGSLADINLTIYYTSPFMLSFDPVSIERLKDVVYTYKIVVDGYVLQEHVDLLRQIDYVRLTPVRNRRVDNARIYYIFENQISGETYSVAIFIYGETMRVNGVNIAENPVLFEVLVPFLPESEREVIERIIQMFNSN